jgi:hypothetical protein
VIINPFKNTKSAKPLKLTIKFIEDLPNINSAGVLKTNAKTA